MYLQEQDSCADYIEMRGSLNSNNASMGFDEISGLESRQLHIPIVSTDHASQSLSSPRSKMADGNMGTREVTKNRLPDQVSISSDARLVQSQQLAKSMHHVYF
jgi:hypothetical protein